jgi:hypothetical protein
MSVTIDYAFVVAVDRNVLNLAQVTESAFRGAVRTKPVTGKAWDANRLGLIEMVQNTSRHQDTPIANPEHTKRRGQILDYSIGVLVDEEDELKTLISPQSEYARELAYALNRRFDRTVIDAFYANAISVAPSGSTETETATANLSSFTGFDGTAAVNHVIANASTGLTVAKVRQVKRLLDLQQCPQSGRHFVTSSYGLEDLLADPQVTSSDFNTLRTLEAGTLNSRWMGFQWHFSDLLPLETTNIQYNFAWHESVIEVGEGSIRELSVDKRTDKNNAMQVLAKASQGGIRKMENWVVDCRISQAA